MAASWKKLGFTGDASGQANSGGDALFVATVLIWVFASNLGLLRSDFGSDLDADGLGYTCDSEN